jgi:hypothetical protein
MVNRLPVKVSAQIASECATIRELSDFALPYGVYGSNLPAATKVYGGKFMRRRRS